jgi:hypothetical protein
MRHFEDWLGQRIAEFAQDFWNNWDVEYYGETLYKAGCYAYYAAEEKFGLDARICEWLADEYRRRFREKHGREWNDPVPADAQQEDEAGIMSREEALALFEALRGE